MQTYIHIKCTNSLTYQELFETFKNSKLDTLCPGNHEPTQYTSIRHSHYRKLGKILVQGRKPKPEHLLIFLKRVKTKILPTTSGHNNLSGHVNYLQKNCKSFLCSQMINTPYLVLELKS
jgi:hypothetical protein